MRALCTLGGWQDARDTGVSLQCSTTVSLLESDEMVEETNVDIVESRAPKL